MTAATLSTPESVNAAWVYLHARQATMKPVSLLMGCPKHAAALRRKWDLDAGRQAFGLRFAVPLIIRISG